MQNKKDTKEKILDTAEKLFIKNTYKSVSMSMIAGELNISKPALYHYFKSKEDLFMEIFTNTVARLEAKEKNADDKDLPPRDRIYSFIISYIEFFIEHSGLIFLMVQRLSEKDAAMFKRMENFRSGIVNNLEELVKQVMKSDKEKSRIHTIMIFGMMNAVAKESSFCKNDLKLSPKEVADHIMKVML